MAFTFTATTFAGNVGAAEPGVDGASMQVSSIVEEYNAQTADVKDKEKKDLTKITKKHLKDYDLNSLKNSNLDFHDAIVKSLDGGGYFVKVPLKGNSDVEKFNGVSVTFDSNKKVTSTLEVTLKETSNDAAELTSWLNGKKVQEVQFEKPDVQPQWSFSYFNDCLSSQGVSWAVIAALGFLCGAACVGTAGAACAPCLYAGAAGSGGTIGYCLGKALRH
ncbi:hypothetical protein D9X91_12730 [Falsibacillus albus]|uniref:Uncharacterized protein n=2 Tax=Falsibacillus albus TaxID=2478915 RepID=A0A3L7K2I8_9BACI|nr:hypothetical protein D9X91_12730 [Falsibacillus albus]